MALPKNVVGMLTPCLARSISDLLILAVTINEEKMIFLLIISNCINENTC